MPADAKLPDWTNADDYNYTAKMTDSAWAWEFLRRNSDYRGIWELWSKVEALRERAPDNERLPGLRAELSKYVAFWGLFTPCDPSLNAEELRRLQMANDVIVTQDGKERVIRDEEYDFDGKFVWWRPSQRAANVAVLNKNFVAERVDALPGHVELFALDVTKGIEPQLKQVRDLFRMMREHHNLSGRVAVTKAQRRLFPSYLRALDADGDGAPLKIIAADIFGDLSATTKAHRNLARAKELRDRDYRSLVALG